MKSLVLTAILLLIPVAAPAQDTQHAALPADNARADYLAKKEKALAGAARGNAYDIYDVRDIYEQGNRYDPNPNLATAYALYEQLAPKQAYAQMKLCQALLSGDPLPKDEARALQICDHVDYDYGAESINTQIFVRAYKQEHGIGKPANPAKARDTYKGLAKTFAPAAVVLGEQDLAEGRFEDARALFTLQASASLKSLLHLAQMVEAGQGGRQDTAEAGWLYTVAAQKGSPEAADWLRKQAAPVAPPARIRPDFDGHDIAVKKDVAYMKDGAVAHGDFYVTAILNAFRPKTDDGFGHGSVKLDCFITAEHRIDICLTTQESHMLQGYGAASRKAYGENVSVRDTDSDGKPTANAVYERVIVWN